MLSIVTWHLITGEYPPQPGGVSDYSRAVAEGLAEAGDFVRVWAPACAEAAPSGGIEVQRTRGHFGAAALARMSRSMDGARGARLLVQYVPQAFGCKGINLLFCMWLYQRRRRIPIDLMFHEVCFPMNRHQPVRHNFLGAAQRLMALVAARAASRIFIASQRWREHLVRMAPPGCTIDWLPVPSNIPVSGDLAAAAAVRRCYGPRGALIGHFSAYSPAVAGALMEVIPAVMRAHPKAVMLLIGQRSEEFRARLIRTCRETGARVHATGRLERVQVSAALSACDLMVQPYPGGVDGRHGSMMALLAHGCAVVTNCGSMSEPVWRDSAAVLAVPDGDPAVIGAAVCDLLTDQSVRVGLKKRARLLYQERFDLRHTIRAYRAIACESR